MIVELSYIIGERGDNEPALVLGLSKPKVTSRARFGDGQGKSNQTSILELSSHNGTHIDAPWHVLPDGKRINDFSISDFVFDKPILVECPKDGLEKINQKDLAPHAEALRYCDLLLVYTGFSKFRSVDPEKYALQSPAFSEEGAQYIVDNFENIRCIGMDFMGAENIPEGRKAGWPVHKILLGNNRKFFHIEDMNLAPVVGKKIKRVNAAPLRMINIEASPVTVIAEIE